MLPYVKTNTKVFLNSNLQNSATFAGTSNIIQNDLIESKYNERIKLEISKTTFVAVLLITHQVLHSILVIMLMPEIIALLNNISADRTSPAISILILTLS